jgi:hypothetical protein
MRDRNLICSCSLGSTAISSYSRGTLHALAEHGVIETTMLVDGGDCEEVLARFAGRDRRPCAKLRHRSMTTSPRGWQQQISTLPSAGASTGSGR